MKKLYAIIFIFGAIAVAIGFVIQNSIFKRIEDKSTQPTPGLISSHPYVNVKKEKSVTSDTEEDYMMKASEFVEKNDSQGAIKALSEGIKKQPNNGDLYSMRGVHYHLIGKNEESLRDHEKSIELTKDKLCLASMYTNKAITEIALKQPENAERDFKKALEYKQPYYITHLEYGKFLLEQGEKSQGIEYLKMAKAKLAEVGPENFFDEADALLKKLSSE